ncbi:RimK family alpha-L-glutamate ligase [Candidatus Peregrinibacteria bacterium]|nr:RimK family alpha-L-glutamate ligase [Candidatus Peregrinibacteria bacterium]
MKIGILHFKPAPTLRSRRLPSDVKMLRNAVKELGHTPKVIAEDKCQLYYTRHHAKVLYAGKPFPKVDIIIPRVSLLNNVGLHASILAQFQLQGIPVLQSYKSVLRAKNKLRTLQFLSKNSIPVPITIVVKRFEFLDVAIRKVGGFPIIIKTPFGSLGKGVAIVESKRAMHSAFDLLLTSPDFSSLLIQEYVEEAAGKDLRAFVIGGKVVAAMQRNAQGDEFRSNLAQGGVGNSIKLTDEEERISLAAAEALKLDFAGVDLLRTNKGPVVMEVNCNPGLEGITEVTGKDIAKKLIKYAVSIVEKRNK